MTAAIRTKFRKAKQRKGKGYESISRDMLQDKRLTLKARGLLAMCESLPDEWECNGVEGLLKFCDKEGYDSVNNAIKELEAVGLFARLKRQGEGGRWQWLWTYSHNPADVAAEVGEWEEKGFRRAVCSGPRNATPPPLKDKEEPAAMSARSQHGSMSASSRQGSPVSGEPPNKEVHSPGVIPPNPPAAQGGQETPAEGQPCEHGLRPPPVGQGCRTCGTSKRAQAQAERDAEVDGELDARRRCPGRMCNPRTGERWDPVTHIPVTPYVKCDHTTPHDVVLAKIRADEAASEARAADRPQPKPHSSPQARAEAMAAVRKLRRSATEEISADDLVGAAS